jgi:dipeptidyl aminopeptidase/acylaminoacyl peptidase
MRTFFLPLLFFTAYSQNSLSQNNITTQLTKKQRWDLDCYVWSHTHYKTSEKDKPVIDFDAIDNWPGLGEYLAISSDGRFIAYNTIKGSGLPSYAQQQDSLIIQSTATSWHRSFPMVNKGFFSADGKKYVFRDKEELCFLKTGSNQISFIKEIASYKVPAGDNAEWIAYQLKQGEVILQNLLTSRQKTFDKVSSFDFDNSGSWLVCQLKNESKELQLYNLKTGKELQFPSADVYAFTKGGNSLVLKTMDKSLSFTNLVTGKTTELWQSAHADQKIKQFAQDDNGSQVVFTVEDGASTSLNMTTYSVWYWKEGMGKATLKVNAETEGIEGLLIQPSVSFTDNGNYIQFSLTKRPDLAKPIEDAVEIDVWSYKDKELQTEQKYSAGKSKIFNAIIDLKRDKVVRLEKENETLYRLQGDFAIIKKKGRDIHGSRFWEDGYYKDSNWLVLLKEDKRILLPTKGEYETVWFSPGGKYLVFFDPDKGCHYFSYDLITNKIKDISATVPAGQLGAKDYYLRTDEKPTSPFGIAGWIEGDKRLLVYDDYDIWQLDPSGEKPPINLTNGYGSLHNILLSPVNANRFIGTPVISAKEPLLLKAFNRVNKYNGYYKKTLEKVDDPELLYMGPCFMQELSGLNGFEEVKGMPPLKANASDEWIVQRQSASLAPNYFVTKDFKSYKQLTNLQPQKDYNWLTAELVSFKQLDGSITQGILYKPENFDSTKKYPVIISFYAQLSHKLYQYLTPQYNSASEIFTCPAWMVSHGYLVFLPDIYFIKNKWGPSTVNTIDGAAQYLKTLRYVDSNHLGVCGHSNSGRFGYYLFTHSNSFAAMSIGSGTTDIISSGLSIDGNSGKSWLETAERTAYGAGGLKNMWENKESWIDHTAVLQADKVTSPLLLYHNKKDAVEVNLATEMFIALRRLNKPVWWLQYDEGFHRLLKLADLKDFTLRFTQYFDYYLNNGPLPTWMMEGIPARLKGVESRYELNLNH